MRRLVTLITTLFLLAPSAFTQTTRYVATTGEDTTDCSNEATPCVTISYAVDQADGGDTIEIAAGEYTEPLTIDKSLIVNGESQETTIIQAHAQSGQATSRVITIETGLEVDISNVTIRHGVSPDNGGGLFNNGSTLDVTNVIIVDNVAFMDGGGVYNLNASGTFRNVSFVQNWAYGPSENNHGGGMYNLNSSFSLANVLFMDCIATIEGGGMYNTNSSPTLTNVVFSENFAGDLGGAMFNNGSSPVLTNTIMWENTANTNGNEIANDGSSSVELFYSLYSDGEGDIVEGGGFTAENSLTDDPLFVDADNGDFRLAAGSPAIDTGDPGTDLDIFPADENDDPIDLGGNPRVFGDFIDIGAYESQLIPGEGPRYVNGATGSDTSNCTDQGSPCATISYAVDMANPGETIEVADGVYTESLNIYKPLVLRGENEVGTIIQAHEEPGQAGDRVITIDGEYEVQISDVTIRHGMTAHGGGLFNTSDNLALTNVTFSENTAHGRGGGMYNSYGNATLTNVTFHGNVLLNNSLTSGGGGMMNWYGHATLTNVTFSDNESTGSCGGMLIYSSSPVLTDVTFIRNQALGSETYNGGGGMCIDQDLSEGGSSPVLTGVTFIENTAEISGGGMFINRGDDITLTDIIFSGNTAGSYGGGVRISGTGDGNTTLTGGAFSENTAGEAGGGLHTASTNTTLTNVAFTGNSAVNGGGMRTSGGTGGATLTNVAFTGNIADTGGGGIYFWGSSSQPYTLTNVTFSGNVAFEGGGVYIQHPQVAGGEGPSPTLTNTILWGNTADASGNEIFSTDSSSVFLSFSLHANEDGDIVEGGGFTAENSLTEDPLFVDPSSGLFQLEDTSPAIDAGHPGTPEGIFATDENGDPIDLDGNPRFFGDTIDIGAYENQGTIADEATPGEIAKGLTLPIPNPVREIASLTVAVEENQDVTVEVFDVTGRRVQTLYDGSLASGTSETLTLDASRLPAGVYVVRATGEDFTKTRRVTVVR